jgi:hypothetical protein
VEAEFATPNLTEIVVPAKDKVKASTNSKPDIDWEAIAPPALPTREDSNEQTPSTKESSQKPASAHELIVESGNHPNIDSVSSASESQVENNHPTQAGVVEAPEVTDTDTPNDSPEFDLSALPNFINDTQPVHRDITDGPAVAIDIPTLSESAATVEDSNATNEALVTTTDAVTTGLKLDEMGELVTSHDNADTGDTTTSLELPTLSDSMRIVISAEDPEVEPALALDVAPTQTSTKKRQRRKYLIRSIHCPIPMLLTRPRYKLTTRHPVQYLLIMTARSLYLI